jgi:hypothetical protein
MALKSQSATKAALDAMNVLANGGKLLFYSGTVPATADTAITSQVLQATITPLGAPAFAAASGTTTASAALNGVPLNTTVSGAGGAASFCRLVTSANAVVQQYTVGQGTGEIQFDNVTWVTGGTVNLTSLTVQLPV